jgi:hypothetical protein
MRHHVFIVFAVALGGCFLALNGLHGLAMALFPLPIALAWVRGDRKSALLFAGLVVPVAWIGAADGGTLIGYVAMAGLGVALGAMTLRGFALGWKLTVFTAVVFSLMAGSVALNWEASRKSAQIFMNARIAQFEEAIASGNTMLEGQKAVWVWTNEHWTFVAFGIFFGMSLFVSAFWVVVFEQQIRAASLKGVRAREVLRVRPSDWLVWPVIGAALLGFVDYQWPNEVVRAISWNTATGLLFVYLLNGFALLVYVARAAASIPILTFVLMFGMLLLVPPPAIAAFGFFDTWYEFRARLDAFLLKRRMQKESDGSDR